MMSGCRHPLQHHASTYVAYHSEHADVCMSAAQQMMGCDGCNNMQDNEAGMQTNIVKADARCL